MKDIVTVIMEAERECSARIEEQKSAHESTIKNLIIRIESKKSEEKRRIAGENSRRYKMEVESSEEAIRQELSTMRKELQHMHENRKLCNEVREAIISLIF